MFHVMVAAAVVRMPLRSQLKCRIVAGVWKVKLVDVAGPGRVRGDHCVIVRLCPA